MSEIFYTEYSPEHVDALYARIAELRALCDELKESRDKAMLTVAKTQGELDGLCLQIEMYLDNGVHLDEPTMRKILSKTMEEGQ